MKYKTIMIVASSFFVLALLLSCQSWFPQQEEVFHYVLDYLPHTENRDLYRNEALPYLVWVQPIEISRTYNRRQIVIRHFGPKVSFSENDLWADRLGDYYPRLLLSRLQAYNSFKTSSMDFLTTRPDFEIDMNLQRLELLMSESLSEAHLNIDFILKSTASQTPIIVHNARRIRNLYSADIEVFVQTINEMFFEELDQFIANIYTHFDKTSVSITESTQESEAEPESAQGKISEGKGVLLLPALSTYPGLGTYRVIGQDSEEFFGEYGVDLPLAEGVYSIEYGSGPRESQLSQSGVTITRGFRTFIEPDWGALSIEIINERREPQDDVIYEIFDAVTGRSLGSEYPAREHLGDTPRIWHLKPGLYKVVIENHPYSSFRNFSTVLIEKEKYKRMSLVVDRPEGMPAQLIGAGILAGDEQGITEGNWRISSIINGHFNMNAFHTDLSEPDFSLDLKLQWDNHLRYSTGIFSFSTSHTSEIGFNYTKNEEFVMTDDDFDLRNSAVVDMYRGIGLYARFDVNTHFFPMYEIVKEVKTRVQPSFFPLVMKEGVGLNVRLLNSPKAEFTFRGGFGLRQEMNTDVLSSSGDEVADLSSAGLELSALGFFRPLPRLQLSLSADALFPLIEGEQIVLDVESTLNFTLFRYVNVNYKFGLTNKNSDDVEDFQLNFDHRIMLGLTYVLN